MNNRARAVKAEKHRFGRRVLRKMIVFCLREMNARQPEDERANEETMELAEKVIMDKRTKVRIETV